MASEKLALFGKTKAMEAEIDEFFDTVSQGGILFEETLSHFMVQGADDVFAQRQQQISEIESNGDNLVKSVVRALYTEMLIPESRADVLSLLQDIDHILDDFEKVCFAVDVERPDLSDISPRLINSFQDLVSVVVKAVETLIRAARAFFRDINSVRDHLHKVNFLEAEADKLAMYLKRQLFESSLPLERKIHLRDFVDLVDAIADEAEDVADWLAIYTIKRSL
jgi:predicted phosphate transport protein (TIGR00153 family)